MAEEVGSVSILGSIDVENLMQGLNQMKRGLDEAKASARASFGDLEKIGEAVEGIATPLTVIGVGLASAILGLAALSPAVAPALAKMEVGFLKLVRILGQELQPVFEEAAVLFQGFVEWMGSEEGRGAIQSFGLALSGVLTILKELGAWVISDEAKELLNLVAQLGAVTLGGRKGVLPLPEPQPERGVPFAPTTPTGPFTTTPPEGISQGYDFRETANLVGFNLLRGNPNLLGLAVSTLFDFITNENPRLSTMRNAGISSP